MNTVDTLTDPESANPNPGLLPIAGSERIQALDVVRGFALIGIFLMNVEYFNRPTAEIGTGLPAFATGIDWLAGWLIYVLVQGKFWTMFSLLFGMGFAVMLTRAERADRDFLRPYMRRIAALAVFGIMHHVLIWGGDILFSYSVGAVGLLLVIYGNWRYLLLAILALAGLGFIPGLGPLQQVAGALVMACMAALFMRWEAKAGFAGKQIPVFSMILAAVGGVLLAVATALAVIPGAPGDAIVPTSIMGILFLALGVLSALFREPVAARQRRLGMTMYLVPFSMMLVFGIAQYYAPPAPSTAASVETSTATSGTQAEGKDSRKDWQAERAKKALEERRIESQGSYAEGVQFRWKDFSQGVAEEGFFAVTLIGMFLIGSWFVRSGIMEDTARHLQVFRKMALYGIPFGVGLGLLGTLIATGPVPGVERDPYQIAQAMLMIGNLPACLGYVGAVVLMLHSHSILSRISVLAPLGRMALTNYITHSVLGTLYFYGYGLGHWGMGRAGQVVFVFVIIAFQVVLCTWWLKHFRYGPLEWLWRVVTYWRMTPIRREPDAASQLERIPA